MKASDITPELVDQTTPFVVSALTDQVRHYNLNREGSSRGCNVSDPVLVAAVSVFTEDVKALKTLTNSYLLIEKEDDGTDSEFVALVNNCRVVAIACGAINQIRSTLDHAPHPCMQLATQCGWMRYWTNRFPDLTEDQIWTNTVDRFKNHVLKYYKTFFPLSKMGRDRWVLVNEFEGQTMPMSLYTTSKLGKQLITSAETSVYKSRPFNGTAMLYSTYVRYHSLIRSADVSEDVNKTPETISMHKAVVAAATRMNPETALTHEDIFKGGLTPKTDAEVPYDLQGSVQRWFEVCCSRNGEFTSSKDLYTCYRAWCKLYDVEALDKTQWGFHLGNLLDQSSVVVAQEAKDEDNKTIYVTKIKKDGTKTTVKKFNSVRGYKGISIK